MSLSWIVIIVIWNVDIFKFTNAKSSHRGKMKRFLKSDGGMGKRNENQTVEIEFRILEDLLEDSVVIDVGRIKMERKDSDSTGNKRTAEHDFFLFVSGEFEERSTWKTDQDENFDF